MILTKFYMGKKPIAICVRSFPGQSSQEKVLTPLDMTVQTSAFRELSLQCSCLLTAKHTESLWG